jgi:nucleotide-binding universal stress UspA family protein
MSTPENPGRRCIVVGLDEHGQPTASLTYAAHEAHRRGSELAIVTVLRPKPDPSLNPFGLQREEARAQAGALQGLHAAAAMLQASHPQLNVSTYCLGEGEVGPNREPLLWAELLVIGTEDRYGRQSLRLGSVSRLLLHNSRCPVLVVPDRPAARPHHRPDARTLIVAGVSEHPADAAVVHAAYAAGTGSNCEIVLLHSYSPRDQEAPEHARERAKHLFTDYLTHAPAGTPVSIALSQEKPATALLGLAREASLLVIGGRTGALSGLVTGSVSHAILETVPCPVLAIPRHLAQSRPGPLSGLHVDAVDDVQHRTSTQLTS